MKTFEETYADRDFQQQLAAALGGWVKDVPRASQPDLRVEGLSDSLFARVLGVLTGRRA
jgi:hypothetical protein